MADFDGYADNYREVINKASKLSGEEFEYFIELRVGMMRSRLERRFPGRSWGRILDFGCGSGATEAVLRAAFPAARIDAIDESGESIRVARQRGLAGVFFKVNGEPRLPYPDAAFDLIYLNGVMHHIREPEREGVLRELRRVLKPGGQLFLYENNPANPLMMHAMAVNPFDAGLKAIAPRAIRALGRRAGLTIESGWYYFFFPGFLRWLRWSEPGLGWLPLGAQYAVWMTK